MLERHERLHCAQQALEQTATTRRSTGSQDYNENIRGVHMLLRRKHRLDPPVHEETSRVALKLWGIPALFGRLKARGTVVFDHWQIVRGRKVPEQTAHRNQNS
jgi:hypothetical protein